jgi:hypothetical protein
MRISEAGHADLMRELAFGAPKNPVAESSIYCCYIVHK